MCVCVVLPMYKENVTKKINWVSIVLTVSVIACLFTVVGVGLVRAANPDVTGIVAIHDFEHGVAMCDMCDEDKFESAIVNDEMFMTCSGGIVYVINAGHEFDVKVSALVDRAELVCGVLSN